MLRALISMRLYYWGTGLNIYAIILLGHFAAFNIYALILLRHFAAFNIYALILCIYVRVRYVHCVFGLRVLDW